ncbi:hypothetical protein C0J52_27603 [Blattella germanica]|nr:hypothetical protein C0J52_27603 [Blattella germanica]
MKIYFPIINHCYHTNNFFFQFNKCNIYYLWNILRAVNDPFESHSGVAVISTIPELHPTASPGSELSLKMCSGGHMPQQARFNK